MAPTKPQKVANAKPGSRAPPKSGVQRTPNAALKASEARAKRKAQIAIKVKQANDKLEELTKHDEVIKNKLKELRKKYNDGANPQFKEELDAVKIEVDESSDKLMSCQTELNVAKQEKEDIDTMDVDTASLFLEEGENDSDGPSSSPHPAWTPAEEDEENVIIMTPEEARKAAGLDTDGTIVAWAKTGISKPVIVSYGPRNARMYRRSTAFRESDFLDESKTQKFSPKNRKGDVKGDDGKLIRKVHEFKGIIGVAFNCPVEDLAPKVKIKKEKKEEGDPPSPPAPRYPRTEVLVSSFCDQYIYRAALLAEKQYNEWKDGKRKSEDRSPTPAPRPWGSVPPPAGNQAVDLASVAAEPAQKVQFKIEEGADNPPTATTLSPMKRYQASWCELNDVDPQNMDAETKAKFLVTWDLIKLKI
ncbi:hypothetical protein V496_00875 [Pseudogymnoascus sp. VKM F-4515 (FW-2607)]|nr:hypothetical protein V496_00875 [Pseudogymnoascus sp. VKM F-4515 (FW-2607)]